MKTILLESISLATYTRLCTLISICLGFVVSTLVFIAVAFFHLNVSIQLGSVSLGGLLLGIVAIFTGPFIAGIVGYLGSILSYRIFLLTLGWADGLSIQGRWKDAPPDAHGSKENAH